MELFSIRIRRTFQLVSTLFFGFQCFNHIIFSKLLVTLLLLTKFTAVNFTVVNFAVVKSNIK